MPEQYPPLGLDSEMPFGKHRGTLIGDLIEKEIGYMKWLIRSTDVELDNATFAAFQRASDAADAPRWER